MGQRPTSHDQGRAVGDGSLVEPIEQSEVVLAQVVVGDGDLRDVDLRDVDIEGDEASAGVLTP